MTEGRREHPPVPPAVSTSAPRARAEPAERNGPLIAVRHRKADGRLLILYRAAATESESR